MKVLVEAVHEAGHAVVAAHLRVPFKYATVMPRVIDGFDTGGHVRFLASKVRELSRSRRTDSWRLRSAEEISAIVSLKQQRLAIVALAGRAADESLSIENAEDVYASDESHVRRLAESIGIAEDHIMTWRLNCLDQARKIVSLPHVRLAIMDVAFELSFALNHGAKRVPAKEIRKLLRYAEDYVRKNAGSPMCNEAAAKQSTPSPLASLCEVVL